MALPLIDILNSVSDKVASLSATHQELLNRIKALEEENSNLRDDLKEANRLLLAERQNSEFLTMSHRLADSPDSIISARRRLARLIRNIDSCISMLKEE